MLLSAAALASAVPTYAHHSFAATYFEDKTQTIEGDLVQFLFRNPHSFVHVEAQGRKGRMQRWAIEWGAGLQLNRQGVTRETLHPGDHVIITGTRDATPRIIVCACARFRGRRTAGSGAARSTSCDGDATTFALVLLRHWSRRWRMMNV